LIELDEEEVPIIDGSAQIFVETFKKIGIVKQRSSIPAVIVKKQLIVKTSTGKIELKPFLRRRISVTINSDKINPVIGRNKTYTCNLDEDLENLSELATARTFGWIDDLETIRNKGFAAGASLDNTIGISKENKIINPEGLRNPKELVMHKCLDLIGDISVLGFDIIGEIKGYNISHQLNNLLMRKLIEEIDQHEIINERFAVKKSEIRPSFGT
jgi:UDP-3-O-[3-hydroxymyristoyl] N-acetylglucosamine deacetylase